MPACGRFLISRTPPHSPLTAPSASPTRPPRQGTPDLSSVSLHASLRGVCFVLIGFPASDPASAGRRCHRYAVGQKSRPVELTRIHQFKTMDNQPSFAQRTAQLKETAFQLQERRRHRACRSAAHGGRASAFRAKGHGQNQGPRLTKKPRRGLAGPLNPNMHIVL